MTAIVTTIKNAVKTKLDSLVPATLGQVIVDDFKQDGFAYKDIGTFPAAVLASPSLEGVAETNRDNLRTHNFTIGIIQKGENISSANDIEELMETIINAFDEDPTLGGAANGGVEPSSSTPESISSVDGSFVVFTVTVKAKAVKNLSF